MIIKISLLGCDFTNVSEEPAACNFRAEKYLARQNKGINIRK
jgi:hypothetical protein